MAMVVLMFIGGTARADQIDNPQYKAWAKFKPGTTVTRNMHSESNGMAHDIKLITKLDSITDQEAVIENSAVVSINGKDFTPPARKDTIEAKIDNDPAKIAAQHMPPPDAKFTEEEVTAGGKTYKAKVFETDTKERGGTRHTKVWFSDDVPGGLIKMESSGDNAAIPKITEELVSVEEK
jgi:hypothetical protein